MRGFYRQLPVEARYLAGADMRCWGRRQAQKKGALIARATSAIWLSTS